MTLGFSLPRRLFVAILLASPTVQLCWSQAASRGGTQNVISLDEALRRAQINEPALASAAAESRVAQLDRTIARTALLPTVNLHNQYLFTEANGSNDRIGQTTISSAPRFIANNSIHEYATQAQVNETLGLQQFTAISIADANAARFAAELEIARRGLFSTVVTLYYSLGGSEAKLATAQRALDEANDFVTRTEQREQAREVAHADVLKAQLQQQQRVRNLADARLAASHAHLELGVLLGSDPTAPFTTEAAAPPPLPSRSDVEVAAGKSNPELRSAQAELRASEGEIRAARAAYLPDLALNYTYGIDAPQYAVNGPLNSRNLGYSASATLDIPIWDWLATEHKVKQNQIRRDAAKVLLSSAQRRLIANLAEFYDEAAAARDQLTSLDASVDTARESLRLTRLRYSGGEGTVLEVVDAQSSLVTAENARTDGYIRYRTALAQLQTLTGRF